MTRREDDLLWKYAPLWATLLGASNVLLKKAVVRYIAKRDLELDWSDYATAGVVALISYLSFRRSYGDKIEGRWYTR